MARSKATCLPSTSSVTRPDAAAGRGRRATASPVAELARAEGIPLLQPASLRDPEVLDAIAAVGADIAPVVAYGGLVPAGALALLPRGWVNLHFSLLPRWRGAAPVERAEPDLGVGLADRAVVDEGGRVPDVDLHQPFRRS